LGRADFAINSGGVKLFPEQIEQKLSGSLPYPFFIGSIKDDTLGESICLFISSESDVEIKKEVLLKLLSKFEVPRYYKIGAGFTHTHNGKIDRLGTIKNYSRYEWRKVL
jgi:O-succinylbenzoic acid--CoA ligase